MIYWKYRVKIPEKSKVVAVWLTRWAASAGDPSLRLKNGSAQDDSRHVIDEVHHYQRKTLGAASICGWKSVAPFVFLGDFLRREASDGTARESVQECQGAGRVGGGAVFVAGDGAEVSGGEAVGGFGSV